MELLCQSKSTLDFGPVCTALIYLATLPIRPGFLDCFSPRRDISKGAIAVPYLLIISLRDPKSDLHHNQNQIKERKGTSKSPRVDYEM